MKKRLFAVVSAMSVVGIVTIAIGKICDNAGVGIVRVIAPPVNVVLVALCKSGTVVEVSPSDIGQFKLDHKGEKMCTGSKDIPASMTCDTPPAGYTGVPQCDCEDNPGQIILPQCKFFGCGTKKEYVPGTKFCRSCS